jgi:hypothetical protein
MFAPEPITSRHPARLSSQAAAQHAEGLEDFAVTYARQSVAAEVAAEEESEAIQKAALQQLERATKTITADGRLALRARVLLDLYDNLPAQQGDTIAAIDGQRVGQPDGAAGSSDDLQMPLLNEVTSPPPRHWRGHPCQHQSAQPTAIALSPPPLGWLAAAVSVEASRGTFSIRAQMRIPSRSRCHT